MPKPMSMPFGSVRAHAALGETADGDATPAGGVADGVLGDAGREHRRQVETGVVLRTGQEDARVDPVGDELPDDLVTGPVDTAHPTQMPVEVSLLDEAVQRELAEARRLHAEQLPPCDRASTSGSGIATKPSRSDGDSVLENVPTYATLPDRSRRCNGSSGRSVWRNSES